MKVLLVGIDGADYQYMRQFAPPWMSCVPLESQIGLTGSEWTSLLTGIPVSQLGSYDYYYRPVGLSDDIVTYRELAGYYVWEIVEDAGMTAAVCRAPACCPVRPPERGWILSGVGARDTADGVFATAHTGQGPPRAGNWYALPPDPYAFASVTHYCGDANLQAEGESHRLWRLCTGIGPDGVCRLAERDGNELVDYFVKHSRDCDFGFIYFGLVDILLHNSEPMRRPHPALSYGVVMRLVERLRQELEPEHLFLVSDHGGKDGHHRSCGVLCRQAEGGSELYTLGEPEQKRGGPRGRLMVRVPVSGRVAHPWTYDVARIVLEPFGLEPRRYGGGVAMEYTDAEREQIEARLRELGYL